MAGKGPGKHYRRGITLAKLMAMFPDNATAEAWFRRERWPTGEPGCPQCGSLDVHEAKHPTMPLRCRDCGKRFSVKTGTVMEGSNIGYQKWALAIYLLTTNLKGVSSMKLHRDLGITQKAAWHMGHRLRRAWEDGDHPPFEGPVEVDETYMGGKVTGRGRGPKGKGKALVAGLKDGATKQVVTQTISDASKAVLHRFIATHTAEGAVVVTDAWAGYEGIPHEHHVVKHKYTKFTDEHGHTTNGIESFWSMLKRGHKGVYHHMSAKHIDRYLTEFTGRHNDRPRDTEAQMGKLVQRMAHKRLKYADLVA